MKIDDVKIYKALIECNNIGRNLYISDSERTDNGYVYKDGMIIYVELLDYLPYATGVHIGMVHDKMVEKLDALARIPMSINGEELYAFNKSINEGKNFFEMEITNKHVILRGENIRKITEDDIMDMYLEKFPEYASVEYLPPNVLIDYRKYKAEIEEKDTDIRTDVEYKIKIIRNNKSKMLDKLLYYKEKYEGIERLSETVTNTLTTEEMTKIMTAEMPYNYDVEFKDFSFKFRMMKSLLKCCKLKESTIEIVSYKISKDVVQNIVINRMKDFTVANLYNTVID